MKFQSLIAVIMHGSRSAARVLPLCFFMLLGGCMSLVAGKHTYSTSSSAVRLNGAEVRMQVKPEGTEDGSFAFSAMVVGAAVATFDGPFRWRIEATGMDGKHQSLVVHRIHTRTAVTKRDEWYPRQHLGFRHDFKPVKNRPGVARAVYPVPGLLMVKPREDGALEVTVDLTVTADGRRERKLVRFRMDPAEKRADEFVFLPAEIVQSIGQSPEDWDQKGWD